MNRAAVLHHADLSPHAGIARRGGQVISTACRSIPTCGDRSKVLTSGTRLADPHPPPARGSLYLGEVIAHLVSGYTPSTGTADHPLASAERSALIHVHQTAPPGARSQLDNTVRKHRTLAKMVDDIYAILGLTHPDTDILYLDELQLYDPDGPVSARTNYDAS